MPYERLSRSTYVVLSFFLDHRPCTSPALLQVFVSLPSSPSVNVAAALSLCPPPSPRWLRPPALQCEPSWIRTQQAYPQAHSVFSFSIKKITSLSPWRPIQRIYSAYIVDSFAGECPEIVWSPNSVWIHQGIIHKTLQDVFYWHGSWERKREENCIENSGGT